MNRARDWTRWPQAHGRRGPKHRERGKTVIIVSHVLREVEPLVDRIASSSAVKLAHLGTPTELTGPSRSLEESLADLYSGKSHDRSRTELADPRRIPACPGLGLSPLCRCRDHCRHARLCIVTLGRRPPNIIGLASRIDGFARLGCPASFSFISLGPSMCWRVRYTVGDGGILATSLTGGRDCAARQTGIARIIVVGRFLGMTLSSCSLGLFVTGTAVAIGVRRGIWVEGY